MSQDRCHFCRNGSPLTEVHKRSLEHQFNFKVGTFKEYRKALVKDRHGIEVKIEDHQNSGDFEYSKRKGKYTTKISAEQLALIDNKINYKCTIKNINTRKKIYITSINLLYPSNIFTLIYNEDYLFGENENNLLLLEEGQAYSCKIQFKIDEFFGSFKIPLTIDLQTCAEGSNPDAFTIVRSIVVADRLHSNEEEFKKSPFTSKQFEDGLIYVQPECHTTKYVDKYRIPGEYEKVIAYGLQEFKNMTEADDRILRQLLQMMGNTKAVNEINYRMFWHIVLWIEEITQSLMLMRYNMEAVTKLIKNGNILQIDVPGLAERRPSVIVGDYIHVRIQEDHKVYEGIVKRVNEKSVEVSYLDNELLSALNSSPELELDIKFVLGRLSFERCHEAVDTLCAKALVKNLFPPASINLSNYCEFALPNENFFNKEILNNPEQKDAVLNIMNMNQTFPYILFGPPGTGKTITIVEAILQIKACTNKRVLVCAPSNSACDNIAIKLIPHCRRNELIRINADARETSTLTEELRRYSNIATDTTFNKVPIEELMMYRIVVTTLVLIGRFAKYNTDYVVIDEAAQATEPEADIAINYGKQVILAGDPKQLGPMVNSTCALSYGLGISLMERLMERDIYQPNQSGDYNNRIITMLRQNFRSHESILDIPNEMFYDKKLQAVAVKVKSDPLVDIALYPIIFNRGKTKGYALEFCSVSSKEKREGASPSYFNYAEVKMVIKYVDTLMHGSFRTTIKQSDIGIITPYKRQVFKIKEALRHRSLQDIEVGTTEAFQGREKRIIIISTVRAQHQLLKHDKEFNLGFVGHNQRFNVATTRAMAKLIIIGNQPVLSTDDKWGLIIEKCINYNTYFGAPFVERKDNFKKKVVSKMHLFKEKDDQYNRPH